MKLYYVLFNVILSIFCMSSAANAQQNLTSVKSIVIDAGHGGKDPGAVNGKLYEKNVTLSVALKLGKLISDKHPDIKIIYTRKDDTFVPLETRSNIANKANADLFISIHTNAAKATAAVGTETYIMGVDKSGANLAVAMRENDVITYESDYSTRYEGYEPGSSESFIIFSLMSYAYQTQSLSLANKIQKEFATGLPMKNRGVKQAGYLVLWRTAMPCILTEIGFISNPEESKFLSTENNQQKIAQLLMNAVNNYINEQNSSEIKPEEPKNDKVSETENKKIETLDKTTDNTITYRTLAAESKTKITINSHNFGPFVSVTEEVNVDNYYKYYIGKLFSYKEALLLHNKIQDLIPAATLIAFRGETKISIEEAKKLKP